MEIKNKSKKQILSIFYLLVTIGLGLFVYVDYINQALPYDDAYSTLMIRLPYADIYNLTATDVHPPLFYWGLKTFTLLFGESIFVMRLFSLVGFIAILLLAQFPIRRLFGLRVAMFFTLLLFLFPVTQYYITDIRMYSWCMFAVLACGLFAYDVYARGKMTDWIKMLAMSILAAYLHNYALMGVFGIYTILFFFMIRNKKKWVYVIVCGLIFILIYSPWILHLLWQINEVQRTYWIKPLGINDIFLHIYYFYSPKETWMDFTYYTKVQMIVFLVLIMGCHLFLMLKVFADGYKDRKQKGQAWHTACLILVTITAFAFPIIMGFIISFTYMPIMVPRYMVCSFGLLVLGMSIAFAYISRQRKMRLLLLASLLLLSVCTIARYRAGYIFYKQTQAEYRQIKDFLKDDNSVFLSHFESYSTLCRLEVLTPGHKAYVFMPFNWHRDFQPFTIEMVRGGQKFDESIILVQGVMLNRKTKEYEIDFPEFTEAMSQNYEITGSMQTSDFALYRMKAKTVIVDGDTADKKR